MAEGPKEFLLEHMADSERGQGRLPKSQRNDALAQSILDKLDARPAPKPRSEPVRHESPHVDGVDVRTYSREETDALRRKRRERFRKLFENQELFLKHRAVRYLRQFPECQHLFDRLRYWKTTYLVQSEDKDAAKLTGDAEAAKVIDQMLAEYEKRTGRPWYLIKKGDEWLTPEAIFKRAAAMHPSCK